MGTRGSGSRSIAFFPLTLFLLLGIAVVAYAFPVQQSAPPTMFTSQNDFLAGGRLFNGEVVIGGSFPAPEGVMPGRSGRGPESYIARARRTDPLVGLGDFQIVYAMTEARQGAAAVLARGPQTIGESLTPPGPHDTTSYLYIIGGRGPNGVSGTIERALIGADGHIHPGLEAAPAGSLERPRYGATAVARGDVLYVAGGYDAQDRPLDSIERIAIGPGGELSASVESAGPGWGGDVAAIIVNGYLYMIGGNTLPRGPDEGALRSVARAAIDPLGGLLPFEDLASSDAYLPVGTAGGRAFSLVSWSAGAPTYWLYYAGGNVGNTQNGATANVYRIPVSAGNDVIGPWSPVSDGAGLVMLADARQLFAAVVSNGHVYVIGGETTAMGHTTFFSTVERAAVLGDGAIGPFVRLDPPNETFINGLERASDIHGIAFNDVIYVPGGRDSAGNALDAIFDLDLSKRGALTEAAVADTALFGGVRDLRANQEIHSLTFDFQPDRALSGGLLFRFRLAEDGGGWSAWSPYVAVDSLPAAIPGFGAQPVEGFRRLLDLTYVPGRETACSAGVVPNPSGIQGPVSARHLEYEVVMPAGDRSQKLEALAINAGPMLHVALPGGYDPAYAGATHPPSCSPSHAIADAGTRGWLRFQGAGFPDPVEASYESQFRFVPNPPAPAAAEVTPVGAMRISATTIDIEVAIERRPGGPFTYDMQFDPDGAAGSTPFMTVMTSALEVYPALRLIGAPGHGLDVNPGNATSDENVVAAPLKGQTLVVGAALKGFDLRSGRVSETGPIAVEDPASPATWPRNPAATEDAQPSFLRYKLEDRTTGTGLAPIRLAGVAPGDWKIAGQRELLDPSTLLVTLEIDQKAKSGPHDLEFTIQNPQIGSTETIRETLHVVPAFHVSSVTTLSDPTPDPQPGQKNDYDWTGAIDPAVGDLGDGVGTGPLPIEIAGYGFRSDTGTPLVLSVTPVNPSHGPLLAPPQILGAEGLRLDVTVPGNTMPGRHDLEIAWRYEPGVSDPYDPNTQAPPVRDAGTLVETTWRPESGSWQTLFIVPPRVKVNSIFGSSNTQSPILLLLSDPTLTVNGGGFATGGPAIGYGSVIKEARLVSMVNTPDEDIVVTAAGTHMVSDCQSRLTMQLESAQRPGEAYQLEMQTAIPSVPVSSRIRDPYSTTRSAEMITVLPPPQCDTVSVACFAVEQGSSLRSVQVLGRNFDSGSEVGFGPDVTVANLDVCNDDPARGCTTVDRLTFDLEVSPTAAPGRRSVVIENGPTSAVSQSAACSSQYDLWVVPVPTLTSVQPGSILQPPAGVGVQRVPIDIYGTNFTSGAEVSVTPPSPDVTVKEAVVVDATHIAAELEIRHTGLDRTYTLQVREPAGPSCLPAIPDKTVQRTLEVSGFREIGIAAVGSQTSQCQGRSGALTVTGTNFRDAAGTQLVSTVDLGPGVTITATSIDAAGTTMTIGYAIDDTASLGRHALTLQPVLAGGTPAVWANALSVTSSPALISISPATLPTGTEQMITISGRNFDEAGADLVIDPAGDFEVLMVEVVNSNLIRARLRTNAQATPVLRSITVVNHDGGSCNQATLASAFRVIPMMNITGVSNHTTQCQGRAGTLMVTGANFKDPAGASLVAGASLGVDVSIDSMTVEGATSMRLDYSIGEGAALGRRALTLTSTVQGADPAAWTNALTITSSPMMATVSPRSFNPGETRQVTITGRNFLDGAVLAVPGADVTFTGVTVVNTGLILATVTVGEAVRPGSLPMTLDNADGACATARLNAAIQVIDPPHVTSWKFQGGVLRILGTNFHPSLQVYIGSAAMAHAPVKITRNSRIEVGKAKPAFPKGQPIDVVLVNPDDGGRTTIENVTR